MRRIAALLLGTGICLRVRWLPSKRNPSDAASRGDDVVGYKSKEGVVECQKEDLGWWLWDERVLEVDDWPYLGIQMQ